jgi:hypothetical protein
VSVGTALVTSSGGTTKTVVLPIGVDNLIQFQNYSCVFGTQNILVGVSYTDSAGTFPAGSMSSTSAINFVVH